MNAYTGQFRSIFVAATSQSDGPTPGTVVRLARVAPSHLSPVFGRWMPACPLLSLAALMLTVPASVFAQNNSLATVIQNNSSMQSALSNQMINLNGTNARSSVPNPANCMPPVDLQRGADGHVPPQLQGDPRYQEYLRCRQGLSSPRSTAPTAGASSFQAGQHLPITLSDFVPVVQGHPVVDQAVANLQIGPDDRQRLYNALDLAFYRAAHDYRPNNVSVSMVLAYSTALFTLNGSQMNPQQTREFVFGVNDTLARQPQFAMLSPIDRQISSDTWIFQIAMITMLRDLGQSDPQARQQAIELSRKVLQQLTGS